MKVYAGKPAFSPINITIETEDELVTLKAALERAVKETDSSMMSGPFGIPIPIPCGPRNYKYREMLKQLDV